MSKITGHIINSKKYFDAENLIDHYENIIDVLEAGRTIYKNERKLMKHLVTALKSVEMKKTAIIKIIDTKETIEYRVNAGSDFKYTITKLLMKKYGYNNISYTVYLNKHIIEKPREAPEKIESGDYITVNLKH